jgi:hypothetical protein
VRGAACTNAMQMSDKGRKPRLRWLNRGFPTKVSDRRDDHRPLSYHKKPRPRGSTPVGTGQGKNELLRECTLMSARDGMITMSETPAPCPAMRGPPMRMSRTERVKRLARPTWVYRQPALTVRLPLLRSSLRQDMPRATPCSQPY